MHLWVILSTSVLEVSASLLLGLILSSVKRGPDISDMCDPEFWVFKLSEDTCGVSSLAGGTVFAGGGGIILASCSGVELGQLA